MSYLGFPEHNFKLTYLITAKNNFINEYMRILFLKEHIWKSFCKFSVKSKLNKILIYFVLTTRQRIDRRCCNKMFILKKFLIVIRY